MPALNLSEEEYFPQSQMYDSDIQEMREKLQSMADDIKGYFIHMPGDIIEGLKNGHLQTHDINPDRDKLLVQLFDGLNNHPLSIEEANAYLKIQLQKKGVKVHVMNMGLVDDSPTGRLITQWS